jgi:hypothetical protein
MECMTSKKNVSAYIDGVLPDEDRRAMRSHVDGCRDCSTAVEKQDKVQRMLRALPRHAPPQDLTVRLRVTASQERTRRQLTAWQRWRDQGRLLVKNMMKPIAVPAVGGFCSAVFLFCSLVPSFTFYQTPDAPESSFGMVAGMFAVPVAISSGPTVKNLAPIGFFDGDAVVDLRIDAGGRIVNFSIVGADGTGSDQLRRSIENNLLFTTFVPATAFGKPIAGTLRLTFRSSRIEVRG